MEIKGNYIKLIETKTGTGKNGNWEAQTFMIEVPGQYPKRPVFELFNNADAIAGLKEGDPVTVSFDLDSSEWNGRFFAKVKAFKVAREYQQTTTLPATQSVKEQYAAEQGGGPDLPF